MMDDSKLRGVSEPRKNVENGLYINNIKFTRRTTDHIIYCAALCLARWYDMIPLGFQVSILLPL